MNPSAIDSLLSANPMRGGREHRVAFLPDEGRVLKVADASVLATESLFDYVTDLLLSNYFFGDDLQTLGGYEQGDRFLIVTSQPYLDGTHPDWPELKAGLISQGLRDPYPNARGGSFVIEDDILGEIDIIDLHVNNVIRDASGWLHPIDAHFYFHDRAERIAALRALGLY